MEKSNPPLSEEFLDEQVKLLEDFKDNLDAWRSQIRTAFNTCARPGLRHLSVLDLPDELLIKIFRYVKDPQEFECYCWASMGLREI